MFQEDGQEFYFADVDIDGNLKTRNLIWNATALAWEAATGSLVGGGNVTVLNFPSDQLVHANNLDIALSTIKEKTDNIDVEISTLATELTLNDLLTELQLKTEPDDTQIVDDSKFSLRVDNETPPYTYIGEAIPGSSETASVWRIFRLDETFGFKGLWVNGIASFSNRWDQHLGLPYS